MLFICTVGETGVETFCGGTLLVVDAEDKLDKNAGRCHPVLFGGTAGAGISGDTAAGAAAEAAEP